MGIVAVPPFSVYTFPPDVTDVSSTTLDAAGESSAVVGELWIEGGAASKVLSAAGGGSIIWRSAASTFSNGSTNVRTGVQDLSGALEDGTFDVYGDSAGGGGGIASSAYNQIPMGTGSKTLNLGDKIALVVEMTARGGADSVTVRRFFPRFVGDSSGGTQGAGFPYATQDIGSLAPNGLALPFIVIVFDDGTLGWVRPTTLCAFVSSAFTTFNSGTTPDEYIGTFKVPVPIRVFELGAALDGIATTDSFEVILYSDPYGTPTVIETLTPSATTLGSTGTGPLSCIYRCTPVMLHPGVTYGVAVRPTTANSITYRYQSFGSGRDALKRMATLLTDVKLASRTNQSGAFSVTNDYDMSYIILGVNGLENGVRAGYQMGVI